MKNTQNQKFNSLQQLNTIKQDLYKREQQKVNIDFWSKLKFPDLNDSDTAKLKEYADYLNYHLVMRPRSCYMVCLGRKGFIQKNSRGQLYLLYEDGRTKDLHREIEVVLKMKAQNVDRGIVGEYFPHYKIDDTTYLIGVHNPIDGTNKVFSVQY